MISSFIKRQLNKLGLDIVKLNNATKYPSDFEEFHRNIIDKVLPFTMTSPERLFGLIQAVQYVIHHQIEGDIVECGVWKGGSMLATAEVLIRLNSTAKNLYLYDTFEGMSAPSDEDISYDNQLAEKLLISNTNKEDNLVWAYSTLDTVKQTMSLSSYPKDKIYYIQGKVEDTIPNIVPEKIAILRLDTDWYESTKHELVHLFPKLVKGGIIIIDDYGYWKGARKAVDEYFQNCNTQILLNRLDETGRIAIKQ